MTKTEKALLDMIAYAEGTLGVSQNGYDVIVDFYTIVDWTPDTDIIHGNNDWNVKGGSNSTAAGRYQFKGSTWMGRWTGGSKTKKGQNVPMTKANQDAAALWLIKSYRLPSTAIDSRTVTVEEITTRSKFDILLQKLAPEWASLPLTKDVTYDGQLKKAGTGFYSGQGGRKSADELWGVFQKALALY